MDRGAICWRSSRTHRRSSFPEDRVSDPFGTMYEARPAGARTPHRPLTYLLDSTERPAVAHRTCQHPEGCPRTGKLARGLCNTHYERWRKTGSLGPGSIDPRRPGAVCSIADCDEPHLARGWCSMHWQRWQVHGDPLWVGIPKWNPRRGAANPSWAGDSVSYNGVHARVKRERGRASLHNCMHCGGRARDWAYDHSDPNERIDPRKGCPYSPDVSRYIDRKSVV